jgi:hypothetical protein
MCSVTLNADCLATGKPCLRSISSCDCQAVTHLRAQPCHCKLMNTWENYPCCIPTHVQHPPTHPPT